VELNENSQPEAIKKVSDQRVGKIGIISDIHGNLGALKKALEILAKEQVEEVFVCGDIVGYGESTNECCNLIRNGSYSVVAGNHDWAVVGLTDYLSSFSPEAISSIEKAKACISQENLKWLKSLPLILKDKEMTFVHSSLVKPDAWYYLTLGVSLSDSPYQDVADCFAAMESNVCFVGHSHIPAIFFKNIDGSIDVVEPGIKPYNLDNRQAIVDVGSVGRPRGRERKASVVIYDRQDKIVQYKWFETGLVR